jgi:hypothetical protein
MSARCLAALLFVAVACAEDPPRPAILTTREDHQRMLELLGIKQLRPGPSGNPKAPNAANADESKATTYKSLPDQLVC